MTDLVRFSNMLVRSGKYAIVTHPFPEPGAVLIPVGKVPVHRLKEEQIGWRMTFHENGTNCSFFFDHDGKFDHYEAEIALETEGDL